MLLLQVNMILQYDTIICTKHEKTIVQLREDTRKGVYVENLTEFEVGCVSDIIKLLMQVRTFALGSFFLWMFSGKLIVYYQSHFPNTYFRVLWIGKWLLQIWIVRVAALTVFSRVSLRVGGKKIRHRTYDLQDWILLILLGQKGR